MKLRVIIAEDEPHARERLKQLLLAELHVELVGECADGKEALEQIRQLKPDIVFLDVQMPELDGFKLVAQLADHERPVLVFVTAHDQFAAKAFEVEAADYLLKPFPKERLREALRRARSRVLFRDRPLSDATKSRGENKPADRLSIVSQGRITMLKLEEIDWVAASDNYVEIHAGAATHLIRKTVKKLLEHLPGGQFAQISRSLIVNMNRIQEIRSKGHGDFTVVLANGVRLDGSRNFRRSLLLK